MQLYICSHCWAFKLLLLLKMIVFSFFLSRMLVYEYVDNGNLDQWLHGDMGRVSPLTWEIRMKIILGTAKGYDISTFFCLFVVYREFNALEAQNLGFEGTGRSLN